MITPQFSVRQDDLFVYVDIRAPHIKASLIQFEVADEVFVFSLPPYYLRLRFPAKIKEDEYMTSSYNLETSMINCKISKMHRGEHFPDLDMISKLLATKRQQEALAANKPVIQDLDANPNAIPSVVLDPEFDWEVEQKVPLAEGLTGKTKYGFNSQYSDRVAHSMVMGNDINELAEPENEGDEAKHMLLRSTTQDQFDPSHYLADLYDDVIIQELRCFTMPKPLELSAADRDRLIKLGQRQHMLAAPKATYIGLIPLVFAWAFDHRANYGDSSVESAWTVGKLAPSMCFLYNSYQNVNDAVIDATARALTKPLYRHWELVMQVWQDVVGIFEGGKSEVLVVFAKLLEVFENDLHAVYRHILIEDYAIWVQYSSDAVIQGMVAELHKSMAGLVKSVIYLPLEETEEAGAQEAEAEEAEAEEARARDSDDESGAE